MDCSSPGLPVPHHFPEFAQVHIHCIGNAIQPSHPRTPSFPSALSLSQHQGLSQWVVRWPNTGASVSASVFPANIQGWSLLRWTGLISLLSKRLLGILESILMALCLLYSPALTIICDHWEDQSLDHIDDITLMAENKEELKSLLMRVKEES